MFFPVSRLRAVKHFMRDCLVQLQNWVLQPSAGYARAATTWVGSATPPTRQAQFAAVVRTLTTGAEQVVQAQPEFPPSTTNGGSIGQPLVMAW